jgi:hypothetical protein
VVGWVPPLGTVVGCGPPLGTVPGDVSAGGIATLPGVGAGVRNRSSLDADGIGLPPGCRMLESLGSVPSVPGDAEGTFTLGPAGTGTPIPTVGAVDMRPEFALVAGPVLGAGVATGAGPCANAAAIHKSPMMAATARMRLGRYMALLPSVGPNSRREQPMCQRRSRLR